MKGKWIQEIGMKKGALRRTAKVKEGELISKEELTELAKKKGVTGKRARLAQTLSKLRKGK